MWTLGIVEAQILSDAGADIGNVAVGVHVDHLIFYRSPQALGEDIVPPGAFAVHGDGDGCVLQHLDKVDERELYLSDNPQMKQVITKAPGLGDPVLLGVTKTPDSFNSLLKQIHRNNRGSKIETR